ncbi:MAG: copper-translocating P-type ATPase [Planctomycetota bacterium]
MSASASEEERPDQPEDQAGHQEHGGDHHGERENDHGQGGHDHGGKGHGGHHSHHQHMVRDFRRRFWISLTLTVPMLLISPTIRSWTGLGEVTAFPGDHWVLWALATAVFVYGGWPFLKGLGKELGKRQPGMMTLIAVAIIVAYSYSSAVVFGIGGKVFFWELATLIDVMLLGHWIEMRSVMGASRALDELVRLMPAQAHRLDEDGETRDVAVSELQADDRVLVRPGEKIPVDGVIVDGASAVDQHMISGESEPVSKEVDDEVVGGAINGDGSLTLRVTKTGGETYLAQVIELVRSAQETKSRGQDLANRAAAWLTGIALGAGLITVLVWYLAVDSEFAFALERAVTVMVITCPHALGLAVPLVVAVSTAIAASGGLLIRNRVAFERARKVEAVVFDKTGTLTEGRFAVDSVQVFDDADNEQARQELLRKAAAVESHSEHPIARAIAESAENLPEVTDFSALRGRGVSGRIGDEEIRIVSRDHLEAEGIDCDHAQLDELAQEGTTVVVVAIGGRAVGAIALSDVVRDESRSAIDHLKANGVRCMMITGDNERVARRVAEQLGIDEYFAGVLPDAKADKIAEVQQRGLVVAMVGDGINDAPALASADIGIAIGAGTDVAIEAADVVLVEDDPRDVARVFDLARATYRKVVQNLFWATGYNVIAIPLAAGVLAGVGIILPPAVGAIIMSVSTVIVAINARLLRV